MLIITIISASVAALFATAWFYTRRRVVLIAVTLWLISPLYNYIVLANCSGDCNIRVDLGRNPIRFLFTVIGAMSSLIA